MAASESHVPNLYAEALADNELRRPVLSRETFRRAMVLSELAADFVTCAGAAIGAYLLELYFGAHMQCPIKQVVAVGTLQGIFALLLLQRRSSSDGTASLLRIRETEHAVRTSVQTLLLLLFVTFALRLNFPR